MQTKQNYADTVKIDRLASALNLILWKLDRKEQAAVASYDDAAGGRSFVWAKIDKRDSVIRNAELVLRECGLA